MNPFLKAAILTVLVAALALITVNQLDNARERTLQQSIQGVTFESDSSRLLARYDQVMGGDERCRLLNSSLWQAAKDRTYALAGRIQDYQRSNVLGDQYEQLKQQYFVSLMDLYFTQFENKKQCPAFGEKALAFFYTAKTDCPQCRAQNDILANLAPRCSNVRIFAFPSDTGYSFLQVLAARYNVSGTPALVVDDGQKLEGLQSAEQIIAALRAAGASCS